MQLPDPWNNSAPQRSFKKPPVSTPQSFKKPPVRTPQSFKKTPVKKPISFKNSVPRSFKKQPSVPQSFKKPPVAKNFNPLTWLRDQFTPAGLLRSGAQTLGITGAQALIQGAGRPDTARMSLLGGDAPVYQTPFNDVTPEQVQADKARREKRFSDVAYIGENKKTKPPEESELEILTPEELDPSTRIINGIEQKGRDLSAINSAYADLFEGMTYNGDKFTPSIYNPFESNHLNTGESRQDLLDMGVDPDVVDNSMAGGSSEWDSDTDTYRQIAPISLQTTEGSPNIVRSGTQKIVEGVNGTIFGAEDEVPETIKRSRTDKLRSKYFLEDFKDKDGSPMSTVQRLRLMRLEQGVVGGFGNRQLGGSPDISTPNMSTPVSEQQYRQYVAGDEGAADIAQELMEKYKTGLKNNG